MMKSKRIPFDTDTLRRGTKLHRDTLVEVATYLTEMMAGEVEEWDEIYFYPFCGCARLDSNGLRLGHSSTCPLTRYRTAVVEAVRIKTHKQ